MATQSRCTAIYRPEVTVHKLNLKYTDPTAAYTVNFGAGVYMLAGAVRTVSQFTVNPVGGSGNCKIGLIKRFLDSAQTVPSDTPVKLGAVDNTNLNSFTELTVATATSVAKYLIPTTVDGAVVPLDCGPWLIPYGLQVTWTNALVLGTAGELEVVLIATRMA